MNLKSIKKRLIKKAGFVFLTGAVKILCVTLKIKQNDFDKVKKLNASGQNYIAAFWHGTMIIPWYLNRDNNFSALVSQSEDGAILAKLLKSWNYFVTRGSSSRSGKEALDILIKNAAENRSIAITPDGPRGPKEKMKAGAVVTAKKSGIPLILMGVGIRKKFQLKSWDSFEIPYPFSKVEVVYSEPLYVNSDLSYNDTSELISQFEILLNNLQSNAKSLAESA